MDLRNYSRLSVIVVFVVAASAVPLPLLANEMVFPGTAWEEATEQSQGLDSAKLTAALDYLKAQAGSDGVRELVIVRNGRLIRWGDNIDKVHGVWSCTKSFTSTCLGL